MPDGIFTADVKLTPILKEFIVTKYGSDIIHLKRNDALATKIKFLLRTNPENYKPITDRRNYIRIEIVNFRLNTENNKRIWQQYRNYLSHDSQSIICNDINIEFKNTFHNYVLAFLRGGIVNRHFYQQKEAIEDFCQAYQLKLTTINYEMLKKSWDRSPQKTAYMNSIKFKSLIVNELNCKNRLIH